MPAIDIATVSAVLGKRTSWISIICRTESGDTFSAVKRLPATNTNKVNFIALDAFSLNASWGKLRNWLCFRTVCFTRLNSIVNFTANFGHIYTKKSLRITTRRFNSSDAHQSHSSMKKWTKVVEMGWKSLMVGMSLNEIDTNHLSLFTDFVIKCVAYQIGSTLSYNLG